MNRASLAGWLAAGLITAGASADIVHFVNPAPGQAGFYEWTCPLTYDSFSWLDITRSASEQPDAPSGSGVSQVASWLFTQPPNRTNFHWPEMDVGAMVLAASTGFGNTTAYLSNGTSIGPNPEGVHWAATAFHGIPGRFTELRYIGVQSASGQYGWIAVSRADISLTAHAWAYETTPGVPIFAGQVPAPGAAAAVALASLSALRRRRP